MPVLRMLLLGSAVLAVSPLFAHPHHGEDGEEQQPAPDFHFDSADRTVTAEALEGPLRYDADVASHGGKLWYAWLEHAPGEGDDLWVAVRAGDAWSDRRRLTRAPGSYARPTLTRDADGKQLWLSFEAERDGQWDVFVLPLSDPNRDAATAQRVSDGAGADINHRAAADPNAGLWFVYQSDVRGQFEIVARHVLANGEQEQPGTALSRAPGGDWHPDVAVSADGTVTVVWDSYNGESYNVLARQLRDGRWGNAIPIARTPAHEVRAQVAADADGRAWVLWEEGGENWGRRFLPRREGNPIELVRFTDSTGPLHRYRRLRLAVLEPGARRARPLKTPLPQPSVDAALRRSDAADIKPMGAFYERARLTLDEAGRLWVAWRHFYAPWMGIQRRHHIGEGWGVYARCYTADGWSPLLRFSLGQGDGMQRLELAPHAGGVAGVWTAGRTDRRPDDTHRGLVTAVAKLPGLPPRVVALGEAAEEVEPQEPKLLRFSPAEVGGTEYEVFFGDLHRHTDLSLCYVPFDGTIEDAYRYAIDAARLDFFAVTDHSRDLALGDALSLLWWRSRREVYRHQLAGTFFPLYGYERSHSNTADHNVISLRGDMLRPHTYPVPEFWKELDADTITIPHNPIRRDTWSYQDEQRRPLMEIYQGFRRTDIAEDAHTGLRRGYHLGFIGSSDHLTTGSSFAAAWAPERSREAIFQALKARRTFGATAKIRLKVTAGSHWMGQRIAAATLPPVEVEAHGTAPIRLVEFIVDGRRAYETSPNRQNVQLRHDLKLAGDHWVYVHLLQTDGNQAWSSPIWLETP